MDKVTYLDSSGEEVKEIQDLFGSYNDFPPGWKEISTEEFAKSGYAQNTPEYMDFRQMCRPRGEALKHGLRDMVSAVLNHMRGGTGYSVVVDWQDKTVRFFVFDCFPKLKEYFEALPVVEDSGWSMDKGTSRPMRGIRDYNRTIKFERTLTPVEEKRLVTFLTRDRCPGWTGVAIKSIAEGVYRFWTTWDSSD